MREALEQAGLDAARLMAMSEEQAAKDELRRNTAEAARRGAFGAPTFFVGDEMFWGNDRLEFVERAAAAFGPAKFALRGLGQVMARELAPQGIHVAYVNIDGPIDMPVIRQLRPELKPQEMLAPAAIAETYCHLAQQERSAWTQEIDLRPFTEKF